WKQFGRPSGVWVDKNGLIYVADSQSDEKTNPGCKMGIRVGSVKDGQVMYYIPPPPGVDAKTPPPEGISVDSRGTIYASAVQMKDVKKYTKRIDRDLNPAAGRTSETRARSFCGSV